MKYKEIIDIVLKLYFYMAPIFPFIKILKELDYKDFPSVLLIITFINCILWIDYGLLNYEEILYTINTAGGAITLIWITIYIIFLAKKNFRLSLGFIIGFFIIIIYLMFLFYYVVPMKITYNIAIIFNILMYAAPGVQIFKVIDTGKYKLMPIFSIIGVFACTIYYFCMGDFEIRLIISNVIGALLSIIQIFVFLFICIKRKSKNKIKINDINKIENILK